MPRIQGVNYDVDYIGRLATNPSGGPTGMVPLNQKLGIVIHYAGGAQNRALGLLALLQSYARWHIRPNGFGNGFTGNGLMYQAGVGDDGTKARTYDARITRWHAGSGLHNRSYVSIVLPIGGSQRATPAQLVALDELCHDFISAGVGQDVRTIIGHQEASWSLCPGELQPQFVHEIRRGKRWAKDVKPPVEKNPDHLVIDVPGVGKFWIINEIYKRYSMVKEPLFLFGYPLGGMEGNPPHQDFERARLHYVKGTWPERHDVQLARVGHELCLKRYGDIYKEKRDQFRQNTVMTTGSSHQYFPETGYRIDSDFFRFWRDWGSLEYFGYPISRRFEEDGKEVQYFERARFELYPDSEWHSDYHRTGLGRVNAELIGYKKVEEIPPALVSLGSYINVAEPQDITAEHIVAACYSHGRKPAYSKSVVTDIAEAIVSRATEFGFRVSIVAAQILHETGFFQYGNQVKPEQFNFVGLGADNTGAAGLSFKTVDEGVLAALAHMALYVYGEPDKWPTHLRKYADRAIRLEAVRGAHNSVKKPDGELLGFLGAVTVIGDYVNGRHAQSRDKNVPIGSLENGYARALVRVANEVILSNQ